MLVRSRTREFGGPSSQKHCSPYTLVGACKHFILEIYEEEKVESTSLAVSHHRNTAVITGHAAAAGCGLTKHKQRLRYLKYSVQCCLASCIMQ